MEHPQEISLLVTHLESLFNLLENQYLQLVSLPALERSQTQSLREKIKHEMKQIVNSLEDLNEAYIHGKKYTKYLQLFTFLFKSFFQDCFSDFKGTGLLLIHSFLTGIFGFSC